MSTVLCEVGENAPPVCLFTENPNRLVSLWDIVRTFKAQLLYWSGRQLEILKTDCLMKAGPGAAMFHVSGLHQPMDEKTKAELIDSLAHVAEVCEEIELLVTKTTISEMTQQLLDGNQTLTYQWGMDNINSIQHLIRREMGVKAFIYIPPENARYFTSNSNPYPLGESVFKAFSSAYFDSFEAGVCMAMRRSTAAVFHLMRVLEIGLGVLGSVFGVSLAHTNWAPAIEENERRIREMHQDAQWKAEYSKDQLKREQEFYAQAASHFGIFKDAWRNYTAHARGKYTEPEAELIFANVRGFMEKLATRLHE